MIEISEKEAKQMQKKHFGYLLKYENGIWYRKKIPMYRVCLSENGKTWEYWVVETYNKAMELTKDNKLVIVEKYIDKTAPTWSVRWSYENQVLIKKEEQKVEVY